MKNILLIGLLCIFSGCATIRDIDVPNVSVETSERLMVDRSEVNSEEWAEAISRAKSHQGEKGRYTLLRVKTNFESKDKVQIETDKLKKFTEEFYDGGSKYRHVKAGDFVLWEHLYGKRTNQLIDPLRIGHVESGLHTLWVDIPEFGKLNVLGDVTLMSAVESQRGELAAGLVEADLDKRFSMILGPIVVGGGYGKRYRFDENQVIEGILLPAGRYKILLPDFDIRDSRWWVEISPGKRTELKFKVDGAGEVDLSDTSVSDMQTANQSGDDNSE